MNIYCELIMLVNKLLVSIINKKQNIIIRNRTALKLMLNAKQSIRLISFICLFYHVCECYLVDKTINRVCKGDFEAYDIPVGSPSLYTMGDPLCWYQLYNTVMQVEWLSVAANMLTVKTKSLDLVSNHTTVVCQNFSLSINKIYEFAFDCTFRQDWWSAKNGTLGLYLDQVYLFNVTNTTPIYAPNIHRSQIFVVVQNAHQFCFKDLAPPTTMWGGPNIDNVTLYEVVQDWTALSYFLTYNDISIYGTGTRTPTNVLVSTNKTLAHNAELVIYKNLTRVMVQNETVVSFVYINESGYLGMSIQIPWMYVSKQTLNVYIILANERVRIIKNIGNIRWVFSNGNPLQLVISSVYIGANQTYVPPIAITNTSNTTTNTSNTTTNNTSNTTTNITTNTTTNTSNTSNTTNNTSNTTITTIDTSNSTNITTNATINTSVNTNNTINNTNTTTNITNDITTDITNTTNNITNNDIINTTTTNSTVSNQTTSNTSNTNYTYNQTLNSTSNSATNYTNNDSINSTYNNITNYTTNTTFNSTSNTTSNTTSNNNSISDNRQLNIVIQILMLQTIGQIVFTTNYAPLCTTNTNLCATSAINSQLIQLFILQLYHILASTPSYSFNQLQQLQFTATPNSTINLLSTIQSIQNIPSTLLFDQNYTYQVTFYFNSNSKTKLTPYFLSLQNPQAQFVLDTQMIYKVFLTVFKSFYPFLSSSFCSYFVVKLVTFWNLSFLYIYLPLRMMPDFTKKIMYDISSFYYNDINFIDFFKFMTTGQKFSTNFYINKQQNSLKDNFNDQASLLANQLNVSTDFLNANFEEISLIMFLTIKLFVVYQIAKRYRKKLKYKINFSKVFFILSTEFVVSLPFFMLSSFCKFFNVGTLVFNGKINLIVHIIFMQILIIVFAVNYIFRNNSANNFQVMLFSNKTIVQQNKNVMSQLKKKMYNKKAQNNQFLIQVFLCIMVPILIVVGNCISFFVVISLTIILQMTFLIKNRKLYSNPQFLVRFSMGLVWILYHCIWLSIFIFQIKNKQRVFSSQTLIFFKLCGLIVLFLLLLGGLIQLISLIVQVSIAAYKSIKYLITLLCNLKITQNSSMDNKCQIDILGSVPATKRPNIVFSKSPSINNTQKCIDKQKNSEKSSKKMRSKQQIKQQILFGNITITNNNESQSKISYPTTPKGNKSVSSYMKDSCNLTPKSSASSGKGKVKIVKHANQSKKNIQVSNTKKYIQTAKYIKQNINQIELESEADEYIPVQNLNVFSVRVKRQISFNT